MPKKKCASNDEFESLKNKYKELSKEINILQIEICNKDEERNDILNKIRKIQNENMSKLNFNLLLDVNSSKIPDISDENLDSSSSNDIVNSNMIKSSSFLSLDKIVIKKPIRKTDMETEDDDSIDITGDQTSSED